MKEKSGQSGFVRGKKTGGENIKQSSGSQPF